MLAELFREKQQLAEPKDLLRVFSKSYNTGG
jgi:hypothetical protein